MTGPTGGVGLSCVHFTIRTRTFLGFESMGATNSTLTPLGPGTVGDLHNATFQADQSPGTANVIDLTGVAGIITLEAMPPPIFTTGSGSLLINETVTTAVSVVTAALAEGAAVVGLQVPA